MGGGREGMGRRERKKMREWGKGWVGRESKRRRRLIIQCARIQSNDERGCDKDCGQVGGLEEG